MEPEPGHGRLAPINKMLVRLLRRLVPPVVVMTALLGAAAAPVAASCRSLDLVTIPRTPDLVVLSGTVAAAVPGRTSIVVDSWFTGPVPELTVTVLGGLVQPGSVTSADWTPAVGERYLVVATARPDGSIVTKPCNQVLVDPGILAFAERVFGSPRHPAAPPPPQQAPADAGLLPLAAIAAALLAVVGLAVVLFLPGWTSSRERK